MTILQIAMMGNRAIYSYSVMPSSLIRHWPRLNNLFTTTLISE